MQNNSTYHFRLIRHAARNGAENMAIDEAIGRAVASNLAPPTLRFYAWQPPCISLGRNQPATSIDSACAAARGYDMVRRLTGGRAILHTDELTYSVVAPSGHPLVTGMVLDTYLRLSHGLVAGLAHLGITAEEAPGTNRAGNDVSAACFEVPSAYEIVSGGRKLLGSAQTRRSDFVLQHGSLPLTGDIARLVECLHFDDETARAELYDSLIAHACTVEDILGRRVGLDEATDALAAGFAEALHIELRPAELTEQEIAWTTELVCDRYGNRNWTFQR